MYKLFSQSRAGNQSELAKRLDISLSRLVRIVNLYLNNYMNTFFYALN